MLAEHLVDVPPPFPGLGVVRSMVAAFAFRPDLVERFSAEAEASGDRWLRAAVQVTLASAAENAGDVDGMRRAATAAYAGFVELGDRWGLSSSLLILGEVATLDGDLDAAVAAYEEAARYVVVLGSAEDDLYMRIRLADLLNRQGHPDRARAAVADLLRNSQVERILGERELIADAIVTALDLQTGDIPTALAGAARLRERIAARPASAALAGHAASICLGCAAAVEAFAGDPVQAAADLAVAYPAARGTHDMPILAEVGLAVAALALVVAEPAEAAALVGAAARVRGAADPTGPLVARLTTTLRDRVGDAFDAAYDVGWALDHVAAVERLNPARLPVAPAAPQARRP